MDIGTHTDNLPLHREGAEILVSSMIRMHPLGGATLQVDSKQIFW